MPQKRALKIVLLLPEWKKGKKVNNYLFSPCNKHIYQMRIYLVEEKYSLEWLAVEEPAEERIQGT